MAGSGWTCYSESSNLLRSLSFSDSPTQGCNPFFIDWCSVCIHTLKASRNSAISRETIVAGWANEGRDRYLSQDGSHSNISIGTNRNHTQERRHLIVPSLEIEGLIPTDQNRKLLLTTYVGCFARCQRRTEHPIDKRFVIWTRLTTAGLEMAWIVK
ncbi:hypothetical protein BDP81DRAFT_181530 [Colletotrichum phormii]|uniref:Uncharacterized protein n=1 Tax=Colletotrichum phormii TaxID=359342 RepID=A0AAJ0A015_9PEZI|nr:uncharacterized protein BDP81DRAFT_181530 [Colletotrichum phormii]KAK1639677.1 hypothetical protein BDP81DRAFT_181530 [Colletotrichum phormii]